MKIKPTEFLGAPIPDGCDLAGIGVEITLIEKHTLESITLRTRDDGADAYLMLLIDAGEDGLPVTSDELAAIAEIGRRMCAMADGEDSKAPQPGGSDPEAAITQTTEQESKSCVNAV